MTPAGYAYELTYINMLEKKTKYNNVDHTSEWLEFMSSAVV